MAAWRELSLSVALRDITASSHGIRQTLEGSFSAVLKPNFASKYAFESSRRDLHNAILRTALNFLSTFAEIIANFCKIREIVSKFSHFLNTNYSNFLEKNDFRAVQRSALCRSRRELSNAYLLAKFGFDTAENEPCLKLCPRTRRAWATAPSRPRASSTSRSTPRPRTSRSQAD